MIDNRTVNTELGKLMNSLQRQRDELSIQLKNINHYIDLTSTVISLYNSHDAYADGERDVKHD